MVSEATGGIGGRGNEAASSTDSDDGSCRGSSISRTLLSSSESERCL